MQKILIFMLLFIAGMGQAEPYTVIEDKASIPILTPSISARKTLKLRLANGLDVFLISDPKADKSGASLAVKVGSWNDPQDDPGLAHFLEHLLFLGTKTYPEEAGYDLFVSEHGGLSNAYTASDRTAYIFSVENDAFPEALHRFSRFFQEPLFNPSGVARELQAIDQEYAKNIENDHIRELYVHKALSDPKHPNHGFSMGNSKTLSKVSRDTLIRWYQEHYSANLMRLVVYSSIPLESLKKLVVEDFGDIPSSDRERKEVLEKSFPEHLNGHFLYIEPVKNIRTLSLMWELPSKFAEMKDSKPEGIVCYVLGHEGEESLLAQLKREKLAEKLGCGSLKLSSKHLMMYLEIELTKEGLKNVDSVIERCFQAIANFREKGIPRYLFDEIQRLAKIRYQYQPEEDEFLSLMTHTMWVEEALATYPEQSLIVQKYDPEAVKDLLNYLTPRHSHIDIMAPETLTGVTPDSQEHWMGVQYAVRPIPEDQLERWSDVKPHAKIDLPAPNPFLPEYLKLVEAQEPPEELIPHPEAIVDSPKGKIYFAQDKHYKVPKISWNIEIKTPEIDVGDPVKVVLADLYIQSVKEALNTISYPATVAGLEYKIEQKKYGIGIKIEGYSENASLLLEHVLEQLKAVKLQIRKYRMYHDILLRKYQNFEKESPYKQAIEFFRKSFYRAYTTEYEKLNAIRRVSSVTFNNYVSKLFDRVYVEGVLYGNMTAETADEVSRMVLSSFQDSLPYSKEEQSRPEVLILPKNEGPFYLEKKIEAQGNAVVLVVEHNTFDFKKEAAQRILMQAMKQPFFSTLRTKQQTGYIVASIAEEVERQLLNLFIVQSNTHNPRDLLARFELFIEGYLQELSGENLPEEQFDTIREALLIELDQPPKNIRKMGEKLTELAFQYDGDFDWIDKQIEGFQELGYSEFLSLAKGMLGRQNKKRLGILLKGGIPEDRAFDFVPLKSIHALHEIGTYKK